MTDTPITDEEERVLKQVGHLYGVVTSQFARQLERENAALKVELDIWKHRAHRAGFKEDLISTSI